MAHGCGQLLLRRHTLTAARCMQRVQVKRIEDPIGLLPAKLILGINKRGVHFFRPVPKEYLHSAELRDIMQFGSSSQAVFFKMRVAGVLHIFQFETRQGEDICMALQTHINDIMMKRYSKVLLRCSSGRVCIWGDRREEGRCGAHQHVKHGVLAVGCPVQGPARSVGARESGQYACATACAVQRVSTAA
jgi:hypothetical protein